MPYSMSNPPDTVKNLPKGAQKIFIETFNAVEKDTKDETKARQAAWANVKKEYRKQGDKWVPKAALAGVELVITKATLQEDGTLRFQATASDTGPDSTGERTSLQLFRDWIERATSGKGASFLPPPRQPFLGLSHYPDLDGAGQAGLTERMWVDGKCFKADGHFQGTPLGQALFEAVRKERELVKRGQSLDEPIRISAAWWDLEHSHGSFVFTRRSLSDVCPMCAQGAGDKQYLRGQLDHLAATRVPINPRTELSLEEKGMAKTRRDDAASIVGEELADELEEKSRQMVGKSETEAEDEALVVKADEEEAAPDVEKMYNDEGEYRPLGGATTFGEAESFVQAQQRMDKLYTNWDMFTTVVHNIMQSDVDRVEAIRAAVREFGDRVDSIKANVTDAYLIQTVRGETMAEEAKIEAQSAEAILAAARKAALEDPKLTRKAKAEAIQGALNTYAETVKAELDAVAPPAAGEDIAEAIQAALAPLADKIGLLAARLEQQPAPTSPSGIAGASPAQVVPQQKSFVPGAQPVLKGGGDDLPVSPITGKPSSIRALINRSVGIQ